MPKGKRKYIYDNELFYNRLTELRKEAGYRNDKELAGALGIRESTISKWKSGTSALRIDSLISICNTFDCDVDYLLGRISTRHHKNNTAHEMTGLSEEAIESLRNLGQAPRSTISADPTLARFAASKFIPRLISYMLTDGMENLASVVRRTIDQNMRDYALDHLSKTELDLFTRAYHHATQRIRIESSTGIQYSNAKERFETFIKEELAEHSDEYAEAIKEESPSALYDIEILPNDEERRILVADAPNDALARRALAAAPEIFDLMYRASDDQTEIIDFLNSKDLYSMVQNFNSQLNKERRK